MDYSNTSQDQSRYLEIREQYADAVRKRKVEISIEQAHVEVARERLNDIENRLTDLNKSGKITYDVGIERGRLLSERATATEKLRQAERKLAIAKVGQDAINEFKSITGRN